MYKCNRCYNGNKKMKYVRIHFKIYVHHLYQKNPNKTKKALLKDTKEDWNNSKTLCSWIERLSIREMSFLPKLMCKFNLIPINITIIILKI